MRWREAKKSLHKTELRPLPSFVAAPISKRLKAFIVDSFMLLMPILYVVFYLVFGSRQGFSEHMAQGWLIILLPYCVITTLFFARTGQTPGYKAYDIMLIDIRTKQKASLVTLFYRFFFWLLSAASLFLLFIPFIRKDRLGVYDVLSHSAPVSK